MFCSPSPNGIRLVVVAAFCLLMKAQVAVSFPTPSSALLPSTSTVQSAARSPQLLASNDKIEVEDLEEYARCMSPREVSSEVAWRCISHVMPGRKSH
jgi:hypothetical protein